jgi:hypothetical protein
VGGQGEGVLGGAGVVGGGGRKMPRGLFGKLQFVFFCAKYMKVCTFCSERGGLIRD